MYEYTNKRMYTVLVYVRVYRNIQGFENILKGTNKSRNACHQPSASLNKLGTAFGYYYKV